MACNHYPLPLTTASGYKSPHMCPSQIKGIYIYLLTLMMEYKFLLNIVITKVHF